MSNLSIDTDAPFLMEDFSVAPDCGGVLFVDDFDVPPPPPPEPAMPPPPLTDADLAAARQSGWNDGFAAAQADAALRETEARGLLALRLAEIAATTTAGASAAARATAESTAHAMLRLLAACLPDLCDQHGPNEARALAAIILPLLTPTLSATLHCHPADIACLQVLLGEPGTAGPAHTLIADATLCIGDLRISWEGGSACRDTRALLAGLTEAMQPLGIALGPEPTIRRGHVPSRRNEREADYV